MKNIHITTPNNITQDMKTFNCSLLKSNCSRIVLVLIWVIISGCISGPPDKELDESEIGSLGFLSELETSPDSVNTELKINFYENENLEIENNFRIGSEINLELINDSPNRILFNPQEGIKIFGLLNGQYEPIPDKMGWSLSSPIELVAGKGLYFSVIPDIRDEGPTEIVVFVTGSVLDGEKITDKIASAYIDCVLSTD